MKTHEELVLEVLEQYRAYFHGLKAQIGSILKNIDLTLAQLRTLAILAEEGPLVIGQIAQRLGIGLSTGGHLVDRLVQAGLAERMEDAEDRRRTLAQLTPKGEDLYARLLNRVRWQERASGAQSNFLGNGRQQTDMDNSPLNMPVRHDAGTC